MKICEFCGTANNDDAVKCSSCGGTGFKFKCNNCGTEFNEGNFCPKCGVKAGQEERVCPKCKTKYFTAACPTCGYIPGNDKQPSAASAPVQPEKPKRKTWLWVLGWIFIFPLPLTLILIKKPNMNKGLKIGIIIAAWVVYFLIGIGAAASDKNDPAPASAPAPTVAATEKETKPPKETKAKAPTDAPEEKPAQAPTEAPTPISFTDYTTEIDAGGEAHVTIHAAPNTEYNITVAYQSGSKADGLSPQITDDNGNTTWTWKVGTNTTPGDHKITVTGGGTSFSATFRVN
jgi:hypothetical protein